MEGTLTSTLQGRSPNPGGTPGGSLLVSPLATIAAVAFAVVLPFAWLGNASGHDFEFHMYSWLEVLGQWKQGIAYPRWAALSHWGYGEARFLFYPPASWHLGALIGAILPWKTVSGTYIWVALTLSGVSMFLLARRYLGRADAIFAAALYAANPYAIVVVYWRSAFAELLAASWLPLLLLLVLRISEGDSQAFLPLSLVVAAVWLTNAPAAVMSMYSLALLLVVVAIIRRRWNVLWYGIVAVLLGLGLAAFYVFPAAYETRWVEIAQVLAPGVRPRDNFLLTMTSNPDHNRFNLLIALVAGVEMVVIATAIRTSRHWRKNNTTLWWTLVAWAAVASALLFPPTLFFWDHLPKLRFVQLPWRWLLCLGVPFALLVTIGLRRWAARSLLCVVLLGVILVGWNRVQPPWWDGEPDIKEMTDAMDDAIGYEGVEEYVPIGVDPYDAKPDAARVVAEGQSPVSIKVTRWAPESKVFTVAARAPVNLELKLYNYPAWRVDINGKTVAVHGRHKTGQMLIPIPSGESTVAVTFTRTWDRTLGILISLLTAAAMIAIGIRQKGRHTHQQA